MKRSLNILLASLLSLMVVFLSVGITFIHCLRYDTVRIGGVMIVKMDCCAKKDIRQEAVGKCACCHAMQQGKQWKSHCMDVKQLKLSPTISIHNVDFDSAPVFAGIPMGTWSLVPRPLVYNIQRWKGWNTNTSHSPPREYLSILNRLII